MVERLKVYETEMDFLPAGHYQQGKSNYIIYIYTINVYLF
jgi:hypothetical protein